MTKDEVIALAAQAHIFLHHEGEMDVVGMQEILRFAELVAAKERELCAQAVINIANLDAGNPYKQALRMGAEAIRARGKV